MRKQNRQEEEARLQQEKAQEAHKIIMFRVNLNFCKTGVRLTLLYDSVNPLPGTDVLVILLKSDPSFCIIVRFCYNNKSIKNM